MSTSVINTPDLPIISVLDELLDTLTQHTSVILQAPPGAGKSTYLPLWLLHQPLFEDKRIVMLEPRRIAAKRIATFIASQLGETVGKTVGYRMKRDSQYSRDTRLTVVTEGMLTRMIQQDPELSAVDLLIFDEFHERSLQADLGLALARDVQSGFNEALRLLIMSATLDQRRFAEQLSAPIVSSAGRQYPVDIFYAPLKSGSAYDASALVQHLAQLITRVLVEQAGSLLVFLPGVGEILKLEALLREQRLPTTHGVVSVYPLYGRQTSEQQLRAIEPLVHLDDKPARKIVLATNIAETSLTIEGIRVVIDSGFRRAAIYDPKLGVDRLQTVATSKASATQRAGRAGRLMPGVCYRVDTEERFHRREAFDLPEIQCSDLTTLCLEVAGWGSHVADLCWIDTPPTALISQATTRLCQSGIFDPKHKLTPLGRRVAAMGLPWRIALLFHHAEAMADRIDVSDDALATLLASIAMLLDGEASMDLDSVLIPTHVERMLSDKRLFASLAWWHKRLRSNVPRFRDANIAKAHSVVTDAAMRYAGILLASAYIDRIALKADKAGRLSCSNGSYLAYDSGKLQLSFDEQQAFDQKQLALVAVDIRQISNPRAAHQLPLLTLASILPLAQLTSYYPSMLSEQIVAEWSADGSRFLSEKRCCIAALVVSRQANTEPLSDTQKTQAMLTLIRQRGISVLPWTKALLQWQVRVSLLGLHDDRTWPEVSDNILLKTLEVWLAPFITWAVNEKPSAKKLMSLPLADALYHQLDYSQQQSLARLAPTHYLAPSGRQFPITYDKHHLPKLSIQLQELFGQTDSIGVMNGKLDVVCELLSPARRPIQVTHDLAQFWRSSYHEVAKDMRGRYPKHRWPEEPLLEKPGKSIKSTARKERS